MRVDCKAPHISFRQNSSVLGKIYVCFLLIIQPRFLCAKGDGVNTIALEIIFQITITGMLPLIRSLINRFPNLGSGIQYIYRKSNTRYKC